ncbi:hypothetical protein AMS68_006074 [Peltaster fructicola]|uniref:Uncharacterized protein n=1 Tax=Peltaster fructicola TaxID=286661 RepID=A0A6H0Y0M6_9PEZI|nr:hypothetical protein AMS68_006074 [Peltaster fructicola]
MHHSKETIFEFLDGTKPYEDRNLSNQRATMRNKPRGSLADSSSKLVSKGSMTSIHADLPFGSPSSSTIAPIVLPTTHSTDRLSIRRGNQNRARLLTTTALCKSASMRSLRQGSSDWQHMPEQAENASPSASFGEVRRISKIPSPVFPSGAKLRQGRHTSSSSSS